jgi:hypothetical protein
MAENGFFMFFLLFFLKKKKKKKKEGLKKIRNPNPSFFGFFAKKNGRKSGFFSDKLTKMSIFRSKI